PIDVFTGNVNVGSLGGNIIGDPNTPNSIIVASPSTQAFYGIYSRGTGTVEIKNNIISNITLSATGGSRFLGIVPTSGLKNICDNDIFISTSATTTTSVDFSSAIIGFHASSTVAVQIISGNKIHSFYNTAPPQPVNIVGIAYEGPATVKANFIGKNSIHSL